MILWRRSLKTAFFSGPQSSSSAVGFDAIPRIEGHAFTDKTSKSEVSVKREGILGRGHWLRMVDCVQFFFRDLRIALACK